MAGVELFDIRLAVCAEPDAFVTKLNLDLADLSPPMLLLGRSSQFEP